MQTITTSITPAAEKESDEIDMNMIPMLLPPISTPPPPEDEVHTSPEDGLSFSPSRFDWGVDEEFLPNIEIEQAQAPTPAMRRASCPGKIERPPMLSRQNNYPPLYCAQASPAAAPPHLNFVAEHQLSYSNYTANTNSSMSPLPLHGTDVAPQLENGTTVFCSEILPHVVKEQQQLPVSTVADYTASNAEVAQFSVNAAPPPLPRSNSAFSSPSPSLFYGQRQQLQLDQKMQSQKTSGPQFSFQSFDDVLLSDTKNQPHCDLNTSGVAIPRCHPTRLSIPSDKLFLDPVHNFLRSSCIEVFVCGTDYNSEGRCRGAKPNSIGQVGLRCVHCKHIQRSDRANQAVSYPSKTDHIFESVRNYQRIHFEACEYIPTKLKEEYTELVSYTYKKIQLKYLKIYFAEAACEIGMVQSPNGLFFGAPPNTSGKPSKKLQTIMNFAENPTAFKHLHDDIFPKSDERLKNLKLSHIASAKTRQVIDNCRQEKAAFVYASDFPTLSDFRFVLLHQFVPCRPSASKLGRRKTLPEKWDTLSGLRCKHCAIAYFGATNHQGCYFPFDLDSLRDTSFFNNLTRHILNCQNVPPETKGALDELQMLAAEHGIITKRGAKSLFLKKLWDRMANFYSPHPKEEERNWKVDWMEECSSLNFL